MTGHVASEMHRRRLTTVVLLTCVGVLFGIPTSWAESPEPGCYDFNSQAQAQKFFEDEGGPSSDPHGLDSDHDGVACEGLSEVGVASVEGSIVLAQATGSASPSPTGSTSPTPSGSASPTPTASGTPLATTTPVPLASALPKTGSPIYVLAIVALCLVLSGLFLLGFSVSRRLLVAPVKPVPKRSRYDDYDLLSW